MGRKGLDMTISTIVTMVIVIAVVLILTGLLVTRTEALTAFGLQNSDASLTPFLS